MRATITVITASIAITCGIATTTLAPAASGTQSISVVCGPTGCKETVMDPSKNSTLRSRDRQTSSHTSGCSVHRVSLPCYSPMLGNFDNADGCYYVPLDPQGPPPPGKKVGEGTWFQVTCETGSGSVQHTEWRKTSNPPPVEHNKIVVTVTPTQLAQRAEKELKLPHPTTGRGPGGTLRNGQPYSLVRANTWFWTDPSTYRSLSKRAQAGPVWASVTVTPVALTLTPGDGAETVSCSGPGTAWVQGRDSPWSSSPSGCDYSYPRSTYRDANEELTATYSIVWKATWVGAGGAGGTFSNITTTTESSFAVAEAEAVVVK